MTPRSASILLAAAVLSGGLAPTTGRDPWQPFRIPGDPGPVPKRKGTRNPRRPRKKRRTP